MKDESGADERGGDAVALPLARIALRRGQIELTADALRIPLGTGRIAEVPFAGVTCAGVHRVGDRRCFMLGSRVGSVTLLESDFRDGRQMDQLVGEIHRRVGALPGAARQLAQLEISSRRLRALLSRRTPITALFGALCLAACAATWWLGGGIGVLVQGGGNAPLLVAEGQLWRLASATFLHSSPLHACMNACAIFHLGKHLERMLGSLRFGLIAGVSALGGAGLSAWRSAGIVSVGASGAIFGMLGALAIIARLGRRWPVSFRQSWRWWAVVVGLNAAIAFGIPQVDSWAHLGGFASGGVLAALLVRRDAPPADSPPGLLASLVTFAVAIAFGVSIGAGGAYARRVAPREALGELLAAAVRSPRSSPDVLHQLAWLAIRDPAPDPAVLPVALRAAQLAVAARPGDADLRSTLARALVHVHRYDEAVLQMRWAVDLAGERAAREPLRRTLELLQEERERARIAARRAAGH